MRNACYLAEQFAEKRTCCVASEDFSQRMTDSSDPQVQVAEATLVSSPFICQSGS
jgi:hypothetical protein